MEIDAEDMEIPSVPLLTIDDCRIALYENHLDQFCNEIDKLFKL